MVVVRGLPAWQRSGMKRTDWIVAGLCTVWLLGMAIIAAGSSEPVLSAMSKSGAAEWAGAVASTLAVCVALGIAVFESVRARRVEARRRWETERDSVYGAFAVFSDLHSQIRSITEWTADGPWNSVAIGLAAANVDQVVRQFDRIDQARFPNAAYLIMTRGMYAQAITTQHIVRTMEEMVSRGELLDPDDPGRCEHRISGILEHFRTQALRDGFVLH